MDHGKYGTTLNSVIADYTFNIIAIDTQTSLSNPVFEY